MGFGWGWEDPRTGTLSGIEFLFTINGLQHDHTPELSPISNW